MTFDAPPVSRRTVLQGIGAAGVGVDVLGSTPIGAATSGHRAFDFWSVVDVTDEGADPTGGEPIDDVLDELADDHTLLEFPPGEYRLDQFRNYAGEFGGDEPANYVNLTDFGMRGEDATLVAPEGTGTDEDAGFFEQVWLDIRRTHGTLFEGFTIDCTAPETGPVTTIGPFDGGVVRDVRLDGIYSGDFPPFIFWVPERRDGECLVENVRAPAGHPRGFAYGGGAPGFFVYVDHRGLLTLRNCRAEGFINGIYHSTPAEGGVRVEGGRYADNEVSQVRVHGPRSHVRGVHVTIGDVAEQHPNYRNQRAIWVWRRGGLTIEDCTVEMVDPTGSQGAIVIRRAAGETTIEDTEIRVEEDGVPALWAQAPLEDEGEFGYGPAPPPGERGMELRNVHITGSAAGRGDVGSRTVLVRHRDGNVVESCCIRQSGESRDGIALHGSDAAVRDVLIDVPGDPVLTEHSDVDRRNVRETGPCPADLRPLRSSYSDPTDPDGDGRYEDINGDGEFDAVDVQALFTTHDEPAVRNEPAAFDFNEDGTTGIVDVQRLFAALPNGD